MKRDPSHICSGCMTEEPFLLYNVRHQAVYRRLCSNCVLKSHPGLFCPFCFEVYEGGPPPPNQRLLCFKCPSISHLACVVGVNASPCFTCPSCSNPSFKFLNLNSWNKRMRFENDENNGGESIVRMRGEDMRVVNEASARVICAAAQIAAVSMTKAADMARIDKEKRVEEAVAAKKRAREALERLAYLALMEKEGEKDFKGVDVGSVKLKNHGAVLEHNKRVLNKFGSGRVDAKALTVQGKGGLVRNGASVQGNQ